MQLTACNLELGAVVGLAHDLAVDTASADLVEKALDHAVRRLGFDGGLIWTVRARAVHFRFAGSVGIPSAVLAGIPAEIGVGPHGRLLELREPLLMDTSEWCCVSEIFPRCHSICASTKADNWSSTRSIDSSFPESNPASGT